MYTSYTWRMLHNRLLVPLFFITPIISVDVVRRLPSLLMSKEYLDYTNNQEKHNIGYWVKNWWIILITGYILGFTWMGFTWIIIQIHVFFFYRHYCDSPQSLGKTYGFYPPHKNISFILHGNKVSWYPVLQLVTVYIQTWLHFISWNWVPLII